jgi:hypothetical protein
LAELLLEKYSKISKKAGSRGVWRPDAQLFSMAAPKFSQRISGGALFEAFRPANHDSADLRKMDRRGSHVWPKLFVQNFKKACEPRHLKPLFSARVVIQGVKRAKRRFLLEISR